MQKEIEATFLETDHDQIRERLTALGATRRQPEYVMRRAVFDLPDNRLDQQAAWVRVRQEHNSVTVCYKQRLSESIDGMREIEFVASNYDLASEFLLAIGMKHKAYQETKREMWVLDGVEIMLDTWPWIPPYVEVEGKTEAAVRAVAERLGFDWSLALFDSADGVYQRYYDVTRTEISSVDLTFSAMPELLQQRARPGAQ